MNNTFCFEIKDLSCSYRPSNPVMRIKNLKIPTGKLIFVLGLSGIGKSTFIETLGLMNNTIKYDQNGAIRFYADSKNAQNVDITKLWQQGDQKISVFRNRHFSFIFQNTNLMPNFTAGENMSISQLISGRSIDEARQKVLEVMNQISLPAEIFDKKINELSGGQRQRLAFVRAITSDFDVLFGDEPTGNLDKNTADRLMSLLKNQLHIQNKTGIVVSHDLDLAINFADLIYPLTPTSVEGKFIGEIDPNNILIKTTDQWTDANQKVVQHPKELLQDYFTLPTTAL